MVEYLKLIKRRLLRAKEQVATRIVESDKSEEGFRMLGYYQGRVTILEDVIDEIEESITQK